MPIWDHSLDLVVLTHPEDHHLGGLVEVLIRYDVSLVLDSGQECTNAACDAWRSLIEQKGIPYRRAEAGMAITVGDEMQLHVLHPPSQLMANTASDINNNSMVLRLEYGRFSVLLTGDIMAEAENALLMSGRALDSPVLKVPHHGRDTSLTKLFLQAVRPQLAIISVGANNEFGHPCAATPEQLRLMHTCRTHQDDMTQSVGDRARSWVDAQVLVPVLSPDRNGQAHSPPNVGNLQFPERDVRHLVLPRAWTTCYNPWCATPWCTEYEGRPVSWFSFRADHPSAMMA